MYIFMCLALFDHHVLYYELNKQYDIYIIKVIPTNIWTSKSFRWNSQVTDHLTDALVLNHHVALGNFIKESLDTAGIERMKMIDT